MTMKRLRQKCKEIYQDDDGWWATLKDGYACGIDDNKVINGENLEQLFEMAEDIHTTTDHKKVF